jgi:hypothetical protein
MDEIALGILEELNRAKKRIAELEAQLAVLDWTPITPENLPKVGDETLDEDGCVDRAIETDRDTTAKEWLYTGFTHRRPINAPRPGQRRGADPTAP